MGINVERLGLIIMNLPSVREWPHEELKLPYIEHLFAENAKLDRSVPNTVEVKFLTFNRKAPYGDWVLVSM